MEIKVVKKFNYVDEIINMISISYLRTKEEMTDALEDDLLSHEKKHFEDYKDLTNQTIEIFEKKMIKSDDDAFFFENRQEFGDITSILAHLLPKNGELLETVNEIEDEELYSKLSMILFGKVATDIKEIVQFLKNEDSEFITAQDEHAIPVVRKLTPSASWKMILIFEDPKKYIMQLAQIIKRNIPAFEYTLKQQRHIIETLMSQLEKQKSTIIAWFRTVNDNDNIFENMESITICPTLIGASNLFLNTNTNEITAGYFFQHVISQSILKEQPLEDVSLVLKILGDTSKFEILKFLKEEPHKYSVEIAEHLELTPATISQHMTTLRMYGLVVPEKVEKKVFYSISKERVKEIITNLERTLL